MSVRDITLGDTFDMKFTTRAFATGIPTTMTGTPTIEAYSGNSITQITAGITLTYSGGFDGVAGLCNVRVVATGGNGFAADTDYALVIAGTAPLVDSVSVLGEVIGHFSTSRSAAAVDLANATDGLTALATDIAAAQTDLDTLTDPAGEPGTGAPAVSLSMVDKIAWLYKVLRNKKDATSTLIQIYDDTGATVHHKRTISDDATTYTEEEIVAGP
jgi:hypothetical protein